MEVIHTSPTATQYTPLSTFQSQTPESFHTGPPILYHHSPSCTLQIRASELNASPTLSNLAINSINGHSEPPTASASANNGEDPESEDREISINGIDVWVTSSHFILFRRSPSSPISAAGLKIPYPTITLHALQRPSPTLPTLSPPAQPTLFLQLLTTSSPVYDDHDPDCTVSLTLVPGSATIASRATATADTTAEGTGQEETGESEAQKMYSALSACANLHPDPHSESEDGGDEGMDGEQGGASRIQFESDVSGIYTLSGGAEQAGLPPPMPGSGGWITAENVGDFFDEEGNPRAGGWGVELGEGAGLVRGRDEMDGDGVDDGDDAEGEGVLGAGNGNGNGETKWRRTG